MHVLIETHDLAVQPKACEEFEPGYFNYEILRTIWFDDMELVAYLTSSLHLPAVFGAFKLELTGPDNVQVQQWTWGIPGFPESSINFYETDTMDGGNPTLTRLVWYNGTTLFMNDMNKDTRQPVVNPPATHGTFSEPMMPAGTEYETSPAVFSLINPGNYDGAIYRFGDLECKEPLQS